MLVTVVATAVISPLVFMTVGRAWHRPDPCLALRRCRSYDILVDHHDGWLAVQPNQLEPAGRRSSRADRRYVITRRLSPLLQLRLPARGTGVSPIAPKGMFNGVSALVFYVLTLAVMFLVLCFDLWPLTNFPAVMKQPVLGVVWTLIALAGAALAFSIGVTRTGADPMAFLTQVAVPFIFGSIIVSNMLQSSLVARMTQPLKGVMNTIAAAAIGLFLANLHVLSSPW